jgi:hypothetical protein
MIFKVCARDGDSSCLSSLILRRYRRWIDGSPRSLALPVASPDVDAGYPTLRIFGSCRRSIFRSPRISKPIGASSGFQVTGFPTTLFRSSRLSMHYGFPRFCIFRPCRRPIIELPRLSYPSAPPARQPQVSPLPRSSRCAWRHRSRLPQSCIFRLCRQRIFELPRISRPSAYPVLELSVSLELRPPGCAS